MKNATMALFALGLLMASGFAEMFVTTGPDACYTSVGTTIRWTCGLVQGYEISQSVPFVPGLSLDAYPHLDSYPADAFTKQSIEVECPKTNGVPICG